jgi:predicted neuraminidase
MRARVLKTVLLLIIGALAVPCFAQKPADLIRTWQGIPGLEQTPRGRLFVSFFSGGTKEPAVENTVYLTYSDDNGSTFTRPEPMAGPREGGRTYDPSLWLDPLGRLWYFFSRGNRELGRHSLYARICDRPDAAPPVWGEEFRVGFDGTSLCFRLNKPVVLSTGEWIVPVTYAVEPVYDWDGGPSQLQGVGISNDKGKSWKLHGAVKAPPFALENMIVELRGRRLWMLMRTGSGFLWESFSTDRGRNWSEPKASTIASPGARFYVRRLASGNLLLVNHYRFTGRSHLTARISTDEGKTWNEGLLLDERSNVSYPDGVQSKDGLIRIVYDRERYGAGEILLAAFREQDVVAGRNVSGSVRLKQMANRLEKPLVSQAGRSLLLPAWDPKREADKVMKRLVRVNGPEVKGAHDADMVLVGDRAYVIAMVNDRQPGEHPDWPFIYATLSVVNLKTLAVEKIVPVARGGQAFENETLPAGACFVPRVLKKDARTLRCYFASEEPSRRQSQTYYLDFNLDSASFETRVHRAKIKTAAGTFDMQPQAFYQDAAAQGFARPPKDYGLYMIDSFKLFDGKTYAVLNNFAAGQNALAVLNPDLDTFEVLGHFNQSGEMKITESAVNRLPDGSWMAICRQEAGNQNYTFTTSPDGRAWSPHAYRAIVPNGTNSKPLFEKFLGVYFLGWQESTRINGVSRSVFNIDVSVDAVNWERKYRFESDQTFQYPGLREHRGAIYLFVTQGQKERIMFGLLE